MKTNVKTILEAIAIIAFLILVFMLYLRLMVTVQEKNGPYEPQRPVVLSDTTNTWPEPDSVVVYEGIVSYTYKQKTLTYIENRF